MLLLSAPPLLRSPSSTGRLLQLLQICAMFLICPANKSAPVFARPRPCCMAFAFLSHVVADLTLGKPALSCLPSSASVRDALAALKLLSGDGVTEISVWSCAAAAHRCPSPDLDSVAPRRGISTYDDRTYDDRCRSPPLRNARHGDCYCIGKVCMQKLVCYLASDQSLSNPAKALDAPVTALLYDNPQSTVQHIDPEASLLEALDLIIAGAQNLIVPIISHGTRYGQRIRGGIMQKRAHTRKSKALEHLSMPKSHNGLEYCWLTQEDVLRFLLGSIGIFSPLPVMSIEDLGIIRTDVKMVGVEEDAVSALEMIKAACLDMKAVAVVDNADDEPGAVKLVGDISCSTLQTCNETAALALATLSAEDFLVYTQDCRSPPDVLVDIIRTRIYDKLDGRKGDQQLQQPLSKLREVNRFLQNLEMWEESSSEDDDESGANSPTGPHDLSRKWHLGHFRAGIKSRSGPIFCNPKSSLIAVLMQALAHREPYVWVTREDDTLLGIVTFLDILTVMLNHINISS